MKTLVVYHARGSHTERLAREIARRCRADLDRIREPGPAADGAWGTLRAAWQSACRATPAIRPQAYRPADYELVVIGLPAWRWGLPAPLRSYLRQQRGQFPEVAFFCTDGAPGKQRLFDEMQRLCGRPPRATMVVQADPFDPPAHLQPLRRFVTRLGS
jgi:hypothetical protein